MYRTGILAFPENLAVAPRVSSVELLSTTTTSHAKSAGTAILSRLTNVECKLWARLYVQMMTLTAHVLAAEADCIERNVTNSSIYPEAAGGSRFFDLWPDK